MLCNPIELVKIYLFILFFLSLPALKRLLEFSQKVPKINERFNSDSQF